MKITKSDFSEAKHSNMKLQKGKDSQEAAFLHFRTLHFEFFNHRQEATCAPLKKWEFQPMRQTEVDGCRGV